MGLKPQHFQEVLQTRPALGFFEVHAENYMVAGGPFHHYLGQIRQHYPLSIHGVGLSIGSQQGLDAAHLARLAKLLQRYQPESFSEHLAWSSHGGNYFNDLLPLPYNATTLKRVCDHVDEVQHVLQRRMLLENPASYVEFEASDMSEAEFIQAVIQRTGCGLLLDVNNAHVSCVNHHRESRPYIAALPLAAVGQIHLAGFAVDTDAASAPLLIDHHGADVHQDVWTLYEYVLSLVGPMPTLLERDNHVPSLAALVSEAMLAQQRLEQCRNKSEAVPV